LIDRRNGIAGSRHDDLFTLAGEERIAADEELAGSVLDERVATSLLAICLPASASPPPLRFR
jgi:hypothetical protein